MTDKAEIAALFDRWNAALNTLDPARVAALYAPDAVLLPTVSNEVRRTPEGVEAYFRNFLQQRPQGRIIRRDIHIYGNISLDMGVYIFALTNDGVTRDVTCRYTFVYRKDPEGWRIINQHSSFMPE